MFIERKERIYIDPNDQLERKIMENVTSKNKCYRLVCSDTTSMIYEKVDTIMVDLPEEGVDDIIK